ncbi:MAG: hypothetical protein OXL37_10530 [Chloroflexota bacterium]|nr:hypothetical protein [Chloroflexota bacterium]MDE2960585.1 hypothetical protein [Chloroflexota bacterium]
MPTTVKTIETIVGLIRAELPRHFSPDFIINDVQAEHRPGTQEEGYFYVLVTLEDGHPNLEARERTSFRGAMYERLEEAGIIPHVVISFANGSEFLA